MVWAIPAGPMPKAMFELEIEQFLTKVPEGATVEIDAYTEKGDPPYNPDVKHVSLNAAWIDESEPVSKLGQWGGDRDASGT